MCTRVVYLLDYNKKYLKIEFISDSCWSSLHIFYSPFQQISLVFHSMWLLAISPWSFCLLHILLGGPQWNTFNECLSNQHPFHTNATTRISVGRIVYNSQSSPKTSWIAYSVLCNISKEVVYSWTYNLDAINNSNKVWYVLIFFTTWYTWVQPTIAVIHSMYWYVCNSQMPTIK